MMSRSSFRRPISRHLGWAATTALLMTIAACKGTSPVTTTGTDQPPQSFLTVTAGSYKFAKVTPSSEWIARYPVQTLQLRSLRHGTVIKNLLRSLGAIDAIPAGAGTVIAAVDFGCRSQLFRIDPASGERTLIRVIPESVWNIALSPDGRRLAYITDPPSQRQPCQRMHQPRHPVKALVWPSTVLPETPTYQVLAIVNLASGATVRTQIPHGADPAWSPDGAEIAATDTWGSVTHVLSATTLARLAMHKFVPLCADAYTATGWTTSGLTVAMKCNIEHGPNLPFVDLVPLTGQARARRFVLPRCTSEVVASYAGRNVLIWAGLGYGGHGPCGFPEAGGYAVAVMLLHGASFGTVATIPRQPGDFTFAGW